MILLALALPARALDKVTFGTNWFAQAEHGGFYQALADGTYARYGLDVTILSGGPQRNNRLLLATGKIDFFMGGNLIQAFTAAANGVPTIVVAAIFQKEPQALFVHPGSPYKSLEDLKKAPVHYISRLGQATFYRWLVAAHGFREDAVRPYTFNLQPFLADPASVVQGYVTSEPVAIREAAGFEPRAFLLADFGFDSYSTTIETRIDLIEANPDLVRRFVEASIIGWRSYLSGDPGPANRLILQENREMTEPRIAAAIAGMKAYGIIDSGDAERLGIGAMTDARIRSFYDRMVKAGVVPAGLALERVYTTRFVNRGTGRKP
jgi:NitT/TauT family transport system substrate-binding protein